MANEVKDRAITGVLPNAIECSVDELMSINATKIKLTIPRHSFAWNYGRIHQYIALQHRSRKGQNW